MREFALKFLDIISNFFLIYLLVYSSYLLFSVISGAWNLYNKDQMRQIKNEIKHPYYFPVSVLIPAYNEEITVVDSIKSLLNLDYRLYEIIVIDDGSKDNTSKNLIEAFNMQKVDRPIRKIVPCKEHISIYEALNTKIPLTLIIKQNGGKGDALNMGINASQYPYFLCIDADSMLQKDTLERIVQPAMEDDKVIAVGGLISVSQCVTIENGEVTDYQIPWNFIVSMQVVEYDRTFLASRIFMDQFRGNLIISGALGLFKKDVVVSVGGYTLDTLGEDMDLVLKLHSYCLSSKIPYEIRYVPNAICWSQVPDTIRDFRKQRRRWHLGLFQCLSKYKYMFLNRHYGVIGSLSYLYFMLYELFSPFIQVFGWISLIMATYLGVLNIPFTISFYFLYSIYGSVLTTTAFYQRIYTQNLRIKKSDFLKVCFVCTMENVFFRLVVDFIRCTAFFGYNKHKLKWGDIQRRKNKTKN